MTGAPMLRIIDAQKRFGRLEVLRGLTMQNSYFVLNTSYLVPRTSYLIRASFVNDIIAGGAYAAYPPLRATPVAGGQAVDGEHSRAELSAEDENFTRKV